MLVDVGENGDVDARVGVKDEHVRDRSFGDDSELSAALEQLSRRHGGRPSTSKPVYIGVPLDVASASIELTALRTVMVRPASDPGALAAFSTALRARASVENGVTILAGPRIQRLTSNDG